MNYAEKKLEKIKDSEIIKEQFEQIITKTKKELYNIKEIDAVVLFGSFARGDYSERHSDIDMMIFLDSKEKNTKLEEKIRKKIINIGLGKLVTVHTIFQYRRIEEEDKSLLLTIADEGKTIFSKKSIIINEDIVGLKSNYLIKFDTTAADQIKKNKLQRFLYGYKVEDKKYEGIVDGEKVISAGKGAIIVPQEMVSKIVLFAESIGVKAVKAGRLYK